MVRAWSARSGFCILVSVGHDVGFFFNMGFCSDGIFVGSGSVVVVIG